MGLMLLFEVIIVLPLFVCNIYYFCKVKYKLETHYIFLSHNLTHGFINEDDINLHILVNNRYERVGDAYFNLKSKDKRVELDFIEIKEKKIRGMGIGSKILEYALEEIKKLNIDDKYGSEIFVDLKNLNIQDIDAIEKYFIKRWGFKKSDGQLIKRIDK